MVGSIQLYSLEKNISQPIEGHTASFSQLQLNPINVHSALLPDQNNNNNNSSSNDATAPNAPKENVSLSVVIKGEGLCRVQS